MSDKSDYFIGAPSKVHFDNRLAPGARLLYGYIIVLSKKEGFCWATNEHFASRYNVSKDTVKKWINALVETGYIHRSFEYEQGTKEIKQRCLQPTCGGIKKSPTPGVEKTTDPGIKKSPENNIKNNTTSVYNQKTNKKNFNKYDTSTPPSYDLEKFKQEMFEPLIYEKIKPTSTGEPLHGVILT